MTKRQAQYTIRKVPPELDRAVRDRARESGKSLNSVLLEALRKALGVEEPPARNQDFDDLIGTWVEDPEVERAIEDQRRTDPELWK